jgi:hypothetical protein
MNGTGGVGRLWQTTMLAMVLATMAVLADPARAVAPWSKVVPWHVDGVTAPSDTTFLTDEADTTRTGWIDTDDFDWPAILAQGSVATGYPLCTVNFICTRANNGVTDSIYFNPEWGVANAKVRSQSALANTLKPDTFFVSSTTIAAAKGTCAQSFIASPNYNVWTGVVMYIPTTQVLNTAGAVIPRFRLRVAGDQSGTTPKLSGLFCIITYLKRGAGQ